MTRSTGRVFLAFVATAMIGMPLMAQDVELPLTWEGKGVGVFVSEGGTNEMDLQLKPSVDEEGTVFGESERGRRGSNVWKRSSCTRTRVILSGWAASSMKTKTSTRAPLSTIRPRMNESNEREAGGWNAYEIVCKGGTIEASINGQLQNKATGLSLARGYIGFQSEGAPIVFRNFQLTPLGDE